MCVYALCFMLAIYVDLFRRMLLQAFAPPRLNTDPITVYSSVIIAIFLNMIKLTLQMEMCFAALSAHGPRPRAGKRGNAEELTFLSPQSWSSRELFSRESLLLLRRSILSLIP
jgi:hypothetical protein